MGGSGFEGDLDLLQRIATRDEAALVELYDRYSRLAYSLIVRILGNPRDAEDVLQEAFVRVWSRANTYDARLCSPGAWLLRIARNRAIDRLRAQRARRSVIVESSADSDDDIVTVREPMTSGRPETVLENHADLSALRSALAALPPDQRTLIEGAFFEGYTHSELAIRFSLPLGTVKTRIRSGLAALRGRLEQVT